MPAVRDPERRTVPPENPLSYRPTTAAKRMLEELGELLDLRRGQVIEKAIRDLYRRETGRKMPKKSDDSGGEPS
jgi:hypothetical protein